MGLDLFEGDSESDAFKAMGYYTLEDFEYFAETIGIPQKRLIKIFDSFLQKTPDVVEMVNRSFLSQEGKNAYLKNYLERLKLHVCYSIDGYSFKGKTQSIIEKHMSMIDTFYEEMQG